MHIDVLAWLYALPPMVIYVAVLLVVGTESLGVPLPGELTLTSAALLSSQGIANPWIIWAAGATGAIVGDSIGYYIGREQGYRLLRFLERLFPRHINSRSIKLAESVFHEHGVKTVFFGRFVAILRILAGPLAGILKMPYGQFLRANATGGIVWSGSVVWVVYFLGIIAEQWMHVFSWAVLIVGLVLGAVTSMVFRARVDAYLEKHHAVSKE